MFAYQGDKKRYFALTRKVKEEYIYPYLESNAAIKPHMKVLEIGCGEAGVLKHFASKGHEVFGIELEESRIELAKGFLADGVDQGIARFLNKDIYDVDVLKDIGHTFDLIILKDVIEHIPNQEKFIPEMQRYLSPGGFVFMAFPPWQMPFGGHQQVLQSKWASRLPYSHLLPGRLYPAFLKLCGVRPAAIDTMLDIKNTGISIERFERIHDKNQYAIHHRQLYLFNPIYKYKFGIKPRKQVWPITHLPYLRNYFVMGAYYIVKQK